MESERLIIRSKTPEGVISFDDYGFAVFSEDQGGIERDHNYSSCQIRPDHIAAWQRYLENWPVSYVDHPNKLRHLLRRGTPRESRPVLWSKLLGCEQQQKTSSFSYSECLRALRSQLVELGISEYCLRTNQQDVWDTDEDGTARGIVGRHEPTKMKHLLPLQILRQIVVDLERTFPTHRLFMGSRPEAKEGRAALFRLLSIYALYNPAVGYCQGMSYLVGMLLMVMDKEEDTFWAMVALFEKPKFLAGYFDKNLRRIQSHASLFHRLMSQRMPRVAGHFDMLGVEPLMYITPWFMCLYTSIPCWDTVLAIWDLIILDGVRTIFRVGLALIEKHQDIILSNTDLTKILPPLLHPKAERVYHDVLMPLIWKTTVEKWEIETLHAVIEEDKDSDHAGMKRQHHVDKTFGEIEQDNKRIKLEEKAKPEPVNRGFFQRVMNVFTPRNQRLGQQAVNFSSTNAGSSGVQIPPRTHESRPAHVGRHRGPGAAMQVRSRSRSRSRQMSLGQGASRMDDINNEPKKDLTCRSMSKGHGIGQQGSLQHMQSPSTRSGLRSSTWNRSAVGPNSKWGSANTGPNSPCRSSGFVSNSASNHQDKGQRLHTPVTPKSSGKSRMFGRLHSQIFGTEDATMTDSKISHPLEDVSTNSTPSPECNQTTRKPKAKLAPKPEAHLKRTSSRNWLSPYCKQYMVNSAATSAKKDNSTSALAKTKPDTGPVGSNVKEPSISGRKHAHSSPPRFDFHQGVTSRSPTCRDLSPDIRHTHSPCFIPLGKENNPGSPLSPEVFMPLGGGKRCLAPSLESLDSNPDGILSIFSSLNTDDSTGRSPLQSIQLPLNNNNNDDTFKTPSHPMHLRRKQYTPGMYSGRTPKSEGRHLESKHNPMNMPSARKLVCKTARAHRSFKIFHTPTPLRKSQVLDFHQSPVFSSPEIELATLSLASPPAPLSASNMDS